jgi:hypothetical protein
MHLVSASPYVPSAPTRPPAPRPGNEELGKGATTP